MKFLVSDTSGPRGLKMAGGEKRTKSFNQFLICRCVGKDRDSDNTYTNAVKRFLGDSSYNDVLSM